MVPLLSVPGANGLILSRPKCSTPALGLFGLWPKATLAAAQGSSLVASWDTAGDRAHAQENDAEGGDQPPGPTCQIFTSWAVFSSLTTVFGALLTVGSLEINLHLVRGVEVGFGCTL